MLKQVMAQAMTMVEIGNTTLQSGAAEDGDCG